MSSNDRLGSAVQDGQVLIGIKILSDKAHLPFLEAILIPAHDFWQFLPIRFKFEFLELANDG